MTPLPFDVSRCWPATDTDLCRRCARWVHQPQQTFGPRTPMSTFRLVDGACVHFKGVVQERGR